jgi:leucyl/phenylalanyl-tRNA--protein transferase
VAADPEMARAMVSALIARLREKEVTLLDMQKPTVFVQGIEYEEMARINYINLCKENELALASQQRTIL